MDGVRGIPEPINGERPHKIWRGSALREGRMCAIIRKRPKAEKPQKSIEERRAISPKREEEGALNENFPSTSRFLMPLALALSILLPQMTPEWKISQAYKAWEWVWILLKTRGAQRGGKSTCPSKNLKFDVTCRIWIYLGLKEATFFIWGLLRPAETKIGLVWGFAGGSNSQCNCCSPGIWPACKTSNQDYFCLCRP